MASRGGKIGPVRWVSPVRSNLGQGWVIKFLTRKKLGQIWPGPVWPSPIWPGPTRPARIFFCFERLFGSTGPVFRAGWAVKMLTRKNQVNFGQARFWPGPLLARPSPVRPARLPPLVARPISSFYEETIFEYENTPLLHPPPYSPPTIMTRGRS